MDDLLFLVHRIPFPPRKGDKVRSWNLLRCLSRRYRVHLAALVDDPQDWRHTGEVERVCETTCFAALAPRRKRLRSLTGLLTGEPLTLPYFHDAAVARYVEGHLRAGVRRVLVFSSAMAQYVLPHLAAPGGRPGAGAEDAGRLRTVVDFVDVDSDKWRQYAQRRRGPMRWVYRRESRTLLAFEREVAQRFDHSVFVSRAEAQLFRTLAPECAERVSHADNGVDAAYFSPDAPLDDPYGAGERALVFTGAMDYWANVDAVTWFAREVFPRLRERAPAARFYVVGARPAPAVRELARAPGVTVTGAVEDVRPYLRHAFAAVAPLRVARGVQNKVLEAMAMAKAVLVTPAAVEGIAPGHGLEAHLAGDPEGLVALALPLLGRDAPAAVDAHRAFVLEHYDWDRNLGRVADLLEPGAVAASGAPAATPA